MVAIKALSVLALAGATVAAPVAQPGTVGEALVAREAQPQGYGWRSNYSWRYGWGKGNQGESTSEPAEPEQPTETYVPEQPETSVPETPSTGSSGGSSGGYMGVVSQWRSNMGLPALTQDSKLEANAQDASDSSGGTLTHKLNSGSMAQVMAPGDTSNFESVFVGGWLCEMPSLPGLSSVCGSASQGWNHAGQTGHAEILSSTKYTKIGCGLGDGIWACDLA